LVFGPGTRVSIERGRNKQVLPGKKICNDKLLEKVGKGVFFKVYAMGDKTYGFPGVVGEKIPGKGVQGSPQPDQSRRGGGEIERPLCFQRVNVGHAR